MKKMKIINTKNEKVIANEVLHAKSFSSRLKGLMFVEQINNGDGMLIEPCNSIHTFFMKFSLDVVFLDKQNKVVQIRRNMKPWRMTSLIYKAVKTLELPAGKLLDEIDKGDELRMEYV